jgi:hypothetical protein
MLCWGGEEGLGMVKVCAFGEWAPSYHQSAKAFGIDNSHLLGNTIFYRKFVTSGLSGKSSLGNKVHFPIISPD